MHKEKVMGTRWVYTLWARKSPFVVVLDLFKQNERSVFIWNKSAWSLKVSYSALSTNRLRTGSCYPHDDIWNRFVSVCTMTWSRSYHRQCPANGPPLSLRSMLLWPLPPLVTAHPMWWPSSWCQLCGPAWREHNDIRELLDSSNAVTQTLVNTRGALHQWTDYTSSCILRLILLPRLFSRSTLKLVQSAVYTASCIFHSDSFIFVQINPKTSSKCSGHFILCLILLHRLWNDDGVSGRLV